jgi:hypothetical protein
MLTNIQENFWGRNEFDIHLKRFGWKKKKGRSFER